MTVARWLGHRKDSGSEASKEICTKEFQMCGKDVSDQHLRSALTSYVYTHSLIRPFYNPWPKAYPSGRIYARYRLNDEKYPACPQKFVLYYKRKTGEEANIMLLC